MRRTRCPPSQTGADPRLSRAEDSRVEEISRRSPGPRKAPGLQGRGGLQEVPKTPAPRRTIGSQKTLGLRRVRSQPSSIGVALRSRHEQRTGRHQRPLPVCCTRKHRQSLVFRHALIRLLGSASQYMYNCESYKRCAQNPQRYMFKQAFPDPSVSSLVCCEMRFFSI